MLSISLSCIISAPTVIMCAFWFVMFISPNLASNESLALPWLVLFLSSISACLGGIVYFILIYFVLARKPWDVVMCLAISLFGILMNICGFLMLIGIAGGSVG
jgi:hypothetical protein